MGRIDDLLISRYRDKGTNFSVSQLTKPDYQLWVEYNSPKDDSKKMSSFKSYLGTAMHTSFETQDIIGVVQEFSHIRTVDGYTIGGTTDRLDWNEDKKKWELGDYKLKGEYSAKKFYEGERESEILQLSMYRWLFEGLFDIDDLSTIFLFIPGHTKRCKYPEYGEVELELKSISDTFEHVKRKIKVATSETPPDEVDCNLAWQCDYCDKSEYCPYLKSQKIDGFKDENNDL